MEIVLTWASFGENLTMDEISGLEGLYISMGESCFFNIEIMKDSSENPPRMYLKVKSRKSKMPTQNLSTTRILKLPQFSAEAVELETKIDKFEFCLSVTEKRTGMIFQILCQKKTGRSVIYSVEKSKIVSIRHTLYKMDKSANISFEELNQIIKDDEDHAYQHQIKKFTEKYGRDTSKFKDELWNKIENSINKQKEVQPDMAVHSDSKEKGVLKLAFCICIFGIICLIFSSFFMKPHEEAIGPNHEEYNRESKNNERISSSTSFENRIESINDDAIYFSTLMSSSSDIIPIKSYGNIMRKHFRSTSSSNLIYP
jgi:hypothetical protein